MNQYLVLHTESVIDSLRDCADKSTGYTAALGLKYNTDQLAETLRQYVSGIIGDKEFCRVASQNIRSAVKTGYKSKHSFAHLVPGFEEQWYAPYEQES